jgi:hypothetical protein
MQRLDRTHGTEYPELTATVTDIKLHYMHIVLIEIIKNILSVVLYQVHHSQYANLLALNQGVTGLVTTDIALTT